MPIYQYENGDVVIEYGSGDLLNVVQCIKIDDDIFGVISIHPIEPGEVGREIESSSFGQFFPPVTLAFKSVEALDIVMESMLKLRAHMVSKGE